MTQPGNFLPEGYFSLREMCKRTGVTYRMLERWCTLGLIPASWATTVRGSGGLRLIDPDLEPVIRLLGQLQEAFTVRGSGGLPYRILERVVENYDSGGILLSDDIALTWEVQDG